MTTPDLAPCAVCRHCRRDIAPDALSLWVAEGPGGDYCPGNDESVNHAAEDYPGAVLAAVVAALGVPARIEGTGGGCEWLNVGPLPGGAHLTITDGDAGLPADEDADAAGWLVQRWTGDPGRDENVATEHDGYPPFVAVDTLTVAGLLDAVRRLLGGEDHR